MTNPNLLCRLTPYALARGQGWAWLEPSPAAFAGGSKTQQSHPSTSDSVGTWESCSSHFTRGVSALRTFCSWSAPSTARVQAQSVAEVAPLVTDPQAAAEYERRLQEFLRASQSVRATTATWPSAPGENQLQQQGLPGVGPSQPDAARSSGLEDSPSQFSDESLQNRRPGATMASPSTADTSAAASTSSTRLNTSRPGSPSASGTGTGGACGGAAATMAALRLATPGTPAVTVTAASAQPQPQPSTAPAGPHPASRTPVDWREMLRRAQQEMAGPAARLSGREMLTDKFSRLHTYLRISLTERCNLRCTYCMPAEGVALTPSQQLLSTQEIMRLARIFVEAGVTKIRLTGGEPTLRRDIEDLVRQLSSLRPAGLRSLAITSNGVVLGRQLPALKEAGLNAVNISLDTLRPDRFEQMARRPGHSRVMDAIRSAVGLGYDPVKVNVVVMRGVNDDEVADFAALTRDQPLNVRFIEYMPFDGNVWSDSKMVPYRELVSRIQAAFPSAPLERLDDPTGEVAKNFRLQGHRGSVSFITSMTQHFCSDCNRLRLLADGSLKVCLFGASEVSLRDAMRGGADDEALRTIIAAAVGRKRAAHAGMFELAALPNRPMITIGG